MSFAEWFNGYERPTHSAHDLTDEIEVHASVAQFTELLDRIVEERGVGRLVAAAIVLEESEAYAEDVGLEHDEIKAFCYAILDEGRDPIEPLETSDHDEEPLYRLAWGSV